MTTLTTEQAIDLIREALGCPPNACTEEAPVARATPKFAEEPETLQTIIKSYAPYDTHEAFGEGYVARAWNNWTNPYNGQPRSGVAAQAWDRGLECACRAQRIGLYNA